MASSAVHVVLVAFALTIAYVVSPLNAVGIADVFSDYAAFLNIVKGVAKLDRSVYVDYHQLQRAEPYAFKSLTDLIEGVGYPVETHNVLTEDGYILNVYRIPYSNRETPSDRQRKSCRFPVLLGHSVMSSSADFTINGPGSSLAFLLVDAGFDVWLMNLRGSLPSQRHIKLSAEDTAFWDFDASHYAYYDYPAAIDYILRTTRKPKLNLVGFSISTISYFTMANLRPEYNNKISLFVGLAAFARVRNSETPLRLFAPWQSQLQEWASRFQLHHFLRQPLARYYYRSMCSKNGMSFCKAIVLAVSGYHPEQMNATRLPVYFHHTPAGFSLRTFIHGLQLFSSGRYQMYDFGSSAENLRRYGKARPPELDPSKFTPRSVLFYGTKDKMVVEEDSKDIIRSLPNVVSVHRIENWTHIDFVWGIDIAKTHNNKIVSTFRADDSTVCEAENAVRS